MTLPDSQPLITDFDGYRKLHEVQKIPKLPPKLDLVKADLQHLRAIHLQSPGVSGEEVDSKSKISELSVKTHSQDP